MQFKPDTRWSQGYFISLAPMLNTHRWSLWIEAPSGEHIFTTAPSYVPGQNLANALIALHQKGELVEGPVPEGA